MNNRIKNWFLPPSFTDDEEKTQRARLLNLGTLTGLLFICLVLLSSLLDGKNMAPRLESAGLILISCLLLRSLMQRGRITVAGIGAILTALILITAGIASLGTVRTATTATYLPVIILAGLMFGYPGLIATGTASSLAVLGLLLAQKAGWLPAAETSTLLAQWVAYTTLFWLTGSLIFLTQRSTQKLLHLTHQELSERKKLEAELQTSRAFAHAVLDALSANICVLAENGTILTVNQGWNDFNQENSGVIARATIGINYLEICEATRGAEAQDAARFAAGIRAVLTGAEDRFELEYPCHSPEAQRWFVGRVTRFYEGDLPRAVITHENISQRKQAEAALQASEAHYRSVVTSISEGVVVYNAQGQVVTCNPMAGQILGLTQAQMLEQPFAKPGWGMLQMDGTPFPSEKHPAHLTLKTGEALRNVVMGLQRPSGELLWINVNAEPLINPGETQPYAVITSFSDITERRRAESYLQASKINFSTFFDHVEDFLFVLDMTGKILKANATTCQRLGYAEAELIGQSVLIVHPPERRLEVETIVAEMLAGKRQECPIPLIDRQGNLIEVETRITRGKWDGEEALFGVSKDVSELKHSEEKFSKAFETSSALMAISTIREGRYVDVNAAFCASLGYEKAEVIGKTSLELHLFENATQRQNLLAEFAQNGSVHNQEFTLHHRAGCNLEGVISAEQIELHGEPHLLTTFINLSERRKAEEALRENEQLLRSFATNLNGIVFIIDKTGIVRLSEGRGLADIQVPPGQAVGLSIFAVHEQASPIQQGFQQALQGQTHQSILTLGELTFETYFTPIRDQAGEVTSVLSIAQNITERKQLERELQTQRDFLEQVINNMGQGLTVTDAESHFELVNPAYARLFGYQPQDLIGKSPSELTAPISQAGLAAAHAARRRGETTTYESSLIRADGTLAPILITGAPRWKDGQVVGAIAVITDLSDLKQAEEALRQSEERLRFLGNNLPDSIVYQYLRRENTPPRFTYVSDGVERLLGLTSAAVIQDPAILIQRVTPEQIPAILEAEALNTGTLTDLVIEVLVNSLQGEQRWVQLRSRPHLTNDGQVIWDGVVTDITQHMILEAELHADNLQLQKRVSQLHDLQNQLREQAIHDPLTQLYNRRYLDEILPRELARARRKNYAIGLLMIDIDFFKLVNDRYGHAAGDEALQTIAHLMLTNLRTSDIICRYGGEEILCLLRNTTQEGLLNRAEELRRTIANLTVIQSQPEAQLTVSIGAALVHAHEKDFPARLKAADEALYRAKAKGRNCVQLANP